MTYKPQTRAEWTKEVKELKDMERRILKNRKRQHSPKIQILSCSTCSKLKAENAKLKQDILICGNQEHELLETDAAYCRAINNINELTKQFENLKRSRDKLAEKLAEADNIIVGEWSSSLNLYWTKTVR